MKYNISNDQSAASIIKRNTVKDKFIGVSDSIIGFVLFDE